jgi:hypothetical protein
MRMHSGLCTVGYAQWAMHSGLCTVGYAQWAMHYTPSGQELVQEPYDLGKGKRLLEQRICVAIANPFRRQAGD